MIFILYKIKKGKSTNCREKAGLKRNSRNHLKKIISLALGLGFIFYQTLSSAESKDLSSEIQTFELQIPDVPETAVPEKSSKEIPEPKKDSPSPLESSLLNVKGELLAAWYPAISPVTSLMLEFQAPLLMENNQLKWFIQAGVGGIFFSRFDRYREAYYRSFEPFLYFPIDTGLRYNFQPLTLSFTLGFFITPPMDRSRYTPLLPVYISHTKWALALGWKLRNQAHISLTAGSFSLFFSPFVGLSASFPIKKW